MMRTRTAFMAAMLAGTMIAGGFVHGNFAYAAADQPGDAKAMSSEEQATLNGDAMKMSRDAQAAYAAIAHARLSIFEGDPDSATKLVQDASAAFDRAKTDRTIFMKAEADFQPADGANGQPRDSKTDKTVGDGQANTPTAWLPVDGGIVMNEDFTGSPAKKAAVSDANKKLANGDRKGAIEKLKLAEVDVDLVIAVVPVKQTIADAEQAAGLMRDGKYYESSQLLRKIEDSVRYDVWNARTGPKSATAGEQTPAAKP